MKTKIYEVQALFYGGHWQNCWTDSNELPRTFESVEDAQQEIDEHIRDCGEAAKRGYMMDTPEQSDFRIVEL